MEERNGLKIKREEERIQKIKEKISSEEMYIRDSYRRDYARVLHSASFRRLEHKTQVFPGNENDFFRNRLTHSLEVAQIAKTIALKLNYENKKEVANPDICEIAGLLHDIGHPPFGHNGEKALDECMKKSGGFEGNAQTLRIITKLEKKDEVKNLFDKGEDNRIGLNLTANVIAAVIKYDNCISSNRNEKSEIVKGYYESEENIVKWVKKCLEIPEEIPLKTIECGIMDLADDIAYSTYDIEDAFKVGFLTPLEMISSENKIFEAIVEQLKNENIEKTEKECAEELKNIFEEIYDIDFNNESPIEVYSKSKKIANDGYLRTKLTSKLVNEAIEGIEYIPNKNLKLSEVKFNEKIKFRVNLLKHYSYICLITAPMLKVIEHRGGDIVKKLFEKLSEKDGYKLLPEDYQTVYCKLENEIDKKRVICDFISGMTDRYALEFYGRFFSENSQTIFKPL